MAYIKRASQQSSSKKQRLSNLKLQIFSIIVVVISSNNFTANAQTDSLIFRNGLIITGTIKSVNPWSVTLLESNYHPFNLLSEIKSSDSSVVNKLKTYYPDLKYSYTGSHYTIELNEQKLLMASEYKTKIAYRTFILLNAISARAESVEFQFNVIPEFYHNLVLQAAVSSGTDLKLNGTYFQKAAMGFGYVYSFNWITASAVFSIADKTLFPDNISATVTYITFYLQTIKDNQWLLSGGLRYHISDIEVKNEKTQFSLNIGLGYNF